MFELTEDQEARASRLHTESMVVNSLALQHVATEERWFNEMRDGGVNVVWVTLGGGTLHETMLAAADALRFIDTHQDVAMQVTSAADMRQAKAENKLGIVFLTQNSSCLDGDWAFLSTMYKIGYRSMGLTYSEGNLLGDGCGERTREVRGLTYFGADVVKEMNRLGILVDVAHSGDATTEDIIDLCEGPVISTHSNVRAISNTTRNKTDEQIKMIAAKNGVVGITPLPRMVNDDLYAASLDGVLDHIDYIVNLVGADHVGIGTDFTDAIRRVELGEILPRRSRSTYFAGAPIWRERRPEMLGTNEDWAVATYAKGLENAADMPNVTRGLVARGYDDDSIAKILGGNWMRVFEAVVG